MLKKMTGWLGKRMRESTDDSLQRLGEYSDSKNSQVEPASRNANRAARSVPANQSIGPSAAAPVSARATLKQGRRPRPVSAVVEMTNSGSLPALAGIHSKISPSGRILPVGHVSARLAIAASRRMAAAQPLSSSQSSDVLLRAAQELHSVAMRQNDLLSRMERDGVRGSTVLSPALEQALLLLPQAMEAACLVPQRTVAALERVDDLASAIRSQAQVARDGAASLRDIKDDMGGFLTTVTRAVNELSALHQSAIETCTRSLELSREELRQQKSHLAELRVQQEADRLCFEREHQVRLAQHERRTRQSARRATALTVISALILLGSVILVLATFASRSTPSVNQSPQPDPVPPAVVTAPEAPHGSVSVPPNWQPPQQPQGTGSRPPQAQGA